MQNLKDLFDAMKAGSESIMDPDHPGQWSTSLPTFGGEEPASTAGVWSWDETHLIVGTCEDDLRIVARAED